MYKYNGKAFAKTVATRATRTGGDFEISFIEKNVAETSIVTYHLLFDLDVPQFSVDPPLVDFDVNPDGDLFSFWTSPWMASVDTDHTPITGI